MHTTSSTALQTTVGCLRTRSLPSGPWPTSNRQPSGGPPSPPPRRRRFLGLLLLVALTAAATSAATSAATAAPSAAPTLAPTGAATEPGAGGRWTGAIRLPNGALGIAVALEPAAGAGWTGTIDIPAQRLRGFALAKVAVEGRRVHFEMDGIPGQPTFDGELADPRETGTFRQGPQTFAFALERSTDAPAAEAAPSRTPVLGDGLAGDWLGALALGPVRLRLALHVETGEAGALARG